MTLSQKDFNRIIELLIASHRERTKAIFRSQYKNLPLNTEPQKNLYLYKDYNNALKELYGAQDVPEIYQKSYELCSTLIADYNTRGNHNYRKTTLWTEQLDIHAIANQLNKDFKTNYPLPQEYDIPAHQNLSIKFFFEHHDAILKQIETRSTTVHGSLLILMVMSSMALGIQLHPGFFALTAYSGARFFSKLNPEKHIERFSIEAVDKEEKISLTHPLIRLG